MKKAVIYARYSSSNQTEQSIEGQMHVCERYAEQNNLQIVGQYIDRAISGTSDNRPEFQRMIANSKKGTFDCVLVYKLDRFARNRYDSALYKKRLRDNGVKVVSATENITDSPEGIIMEGLLEAMDEYYSAELSRKVQRGFKESFEKGRYLGSVTPFGYKIVDHKLEIDIETAPIACEIFQRYADGERYADITGDLNRRKIPNAVGNQWSRTNLSKMLPNRIYIGEYVRSSMDNPMPCPAIVSKDIFEKVQNRRKESANMRRQRRTDFQYYLTGKITCGKCGFRMNGQSSHYGKYNYYTCGYGGCRKAMVRANQLHDAVRYALQEYLTSDKVGELAQAAFRVYQDENRQATDCNILEKQLSKIEKQIQNAINAILNGANSDSLKSRLSELEMQKAEIEEQIESAKVHPPRLTLEHFKFALQELIKKADTDDIKKLTDTIIDRIVIKDKQAIICINLTDETNEPPLEQILLSVSDTSVSLTQNKITFTSGWLLISA